MVQAESRVRTQTRQHTTAWIRHVTRWRGYAAARTPLSGHTTKRLVVLCCCCNVTMSHELSVLTGVKFGLARHGQKSPFQVPLHSWSGRSGGPNAVIIIRHLPLHHQPPLSSVLTVHRPLPNLQPSAFIPLPELSNLGQCPLSASRYFQSGWLGQIKSPTSHSSSAAILITPSALPALTGVCQTQNFHRPTPFACS